MRNFIPVQPVHGSVNRCLQLNYKPIYPGVSPQHICSQEDENWQWQEIQVEVTESVFNHEKEQVWAAAPWAIREGQAPTVCPGREDKEGKRSLQLPLITESVGTNAVSC